LNDLLIGKFDIYFVLLAGVLVVVLLVRILGDIALLLFNLLDELFLITLVETDLSSTADESTHSLCHSPPSHSILSHGDLVDVAIDDRHSVTYSITHVEHCPGGLPCGEQGEHSLDVHLETGHLKTFEVNLTHFLFVFLGVERRFSVEASLVLRLYLEAVSVAEFPYLLHFLPVSHNAIHHRVCDGADGPLLLGLPAEKDFICAVLNDFVLLGDALLIRFSEFGHIFPWVSKL